MTQKVEEAWKACQFDRLSDLEALVPSVVSQNASTFNPENHVHTLLMCSAAHGSIDCAKYLLDKGANVNLKNFSGFTALHWAAFTGRTETLELLIEKGAEVESKTEDGRTPLHIASLRGHLEFVEELLKLESENKVDINSVSSNGWNALHFSIISNSLPVAQKLIELGIDFTSIDSEGKTIEDLAEKYQRKWIKELIHQ